MDAETARKILRGQLAKVTVEAKIASAKFDEVMRAGTTGLPQPDGLHFIRNVSREYAESRQKLIVAMKRLNDLILHGVIPDDL